MRWTAMYVATLSALKNIDDFVSDSHNHVSEHLSEGYMLIELLVLLSYRCIYTNPKLHGIVFAVPRGQGE